MADVLEILIAERDRIERAIAVLQGTAPRRGRPPGRRGPGRPPGSGRKKAVKKVARKGRLSASARKRISEAQKKRWAARRKAAKKAAKSDHP